MNNKGLAKTKPVETIRQHTELLLKNFELLKRLYPCIQVDWELLRLVILYHDLGKINTKFQNKLYRFLDYPPLEDRFRSEEEIPHGNLSVTFLDRLKLIEEYDDEVLQILYQSIYFHHPRALAKDRLDYFKEVIATDLRQYASLLKEDWDLPYFRIEPKADFNRFIRHRIDVQPDNDLFYRYGLTKGLLNRLDYAASAHIDVEKPHHDLERKTFEFLESKGGPRDLQTYLHARQNQDHVVVASTGLGKTEAGLLWIGNNKGFFTLPLRVSINAIFKRIKYKDIGYNDTALLHSDALSSLIKMGENGNYLLEYEKARQLSFPLTITTVDQLFKFVFKEEGFESFLATLSYSKVIIDEIQMYTPEIIACILMGLKHLSRAGGKFSILTATFPKVLEHFMQKLGLSYEYREFILDFTRHKVEIIEDNITGAVREIEKKSREAKVLVIVNTVKRAQEIFASLPGSVNKHLLHSRFIKRDRTRLENDIMIFSDGTDPGVWITTQVVEASLDIDFDYLYTELSTLDSLFQRMGRCYRKRTLSGNISNVKVFTGDCSGLGKVVDTDLFQLSREALLPYHLKTLSEMDKLSLVKEVYSLEKIKPTAYYKDIKSRLELLEEIPAYEFERREVEEKFRNIRSYTVIPASVYIRERENINAIITHLGALDFSDRDKLERVKKLDAINELTVDVPAYFKKYILDEVKIDRYHRINTIKLQYDEAMGLLPDEDDLNYQ